MSKIGLKMAEIRILSLNTSDSHSFVGDTKKIRENILRFKILILQIYALLLQVQKVSRLCRIKVI